MENNISYNSKESFTRGLLECIAFVYIDRTNDYPLCKRSSRFLLSRVGEGQTYSKCNLHILCVHLCVRVCVGVGDVYEGWAGWE